MHNFLVNSSSLLIYLGKPQVPQLNHPPQESDVLAVVEGGDGTFSWLNTQPPYSCSIASPKKESKLKGLKSFIAYQLTPSVSRATNKMSARSWTGPVKNMPVSIEVIFG